jgi:hypothetical protein
MPVPTGCHDSPSRECGHGWAGSSIQAAPSFQTTGIFNGASFIAGPIAPNTSVAIKGNGLSATTGTWQVTGSTLPTAVNGVGVTVNGTAAPVSFASNTQVNFLDPSTMSAGLAQIQITNNGLTSATVTSTWILLRRRSSRYDQCTQRQ